MKKNTINKKDAMRFKDCVIDAINGQDKWARAYPDAGTEYLITQLRNLANLLNIME